MTAHKHADRPQSKQPSHGILFSPFPKPTDNKRGRGNNAAPRGEKSKGGYKNGICRGGRHTQSRKRERQNSPSATRLHLISHLQFHLMHCFSGPKMAATHVRDNNARAFCVLSEIFSSLHLPIP
jgi:hypothetical protein